MEIKKAQKWVYCAVGNIKRSHTAEDGTVKYGTPAFRGGSRVFLCGRCHDGGDTTITAIGLGRKSRRYTVADVPVELIENVRLSRAFSPAVLEIMYNYEFWELWWGSTPEDRASCAAFIASWNNNRP